MIDSLLIILTLLGLFWAFTSYYLRGPSLARYDRAPGSENLPVPREPSEQHFEILDILARMHETRVEGSFKQRIIKMREYCDDMGTRVNLEGVRIIPTQAGDVPAEWVVAEDADPGRRLLYIHGGAFYMGSPLSHRAITARFARANCTSVLAIDYRVLPEYRRLDCLADTQTAYRWILENGPEGPAPLHTLFVAGDSAGGNLTLAVIAWARDMGLRAADAVIALSPSTDNTASSPSLSANVASDPFIGPSLGKIMALPNFAWLWIAWISNRLRPCDPRLSPIHGDLSNLPPTLIHASDVEMLVDDGRRYVNKALSCGSEATLEIWPDMVHVWHLFTENLPEAQQAFQHIEKFMELNAPQ